MCEENIIIENINLGMISDSDLSDVARLIYGTDDQIYPDTFGTIENAQIIIPNLIKKLNGAFSAENIRIAKKDNRIIGAIVFSQNGYFSHNISKEQYTNLPESFKDVSEKYYKELSAAYEGKESMMIYGLCICVDENYRKNNIGSMLLHQLIKEHGNDKDIVLDVLMRNTECFKLCDKFGFKKYGNAYDDYASDGKTLPCQTMIRLKWEN